MGNNNEKILTMNERVCPFPTGLAIDPATGEMKVIGSSGFCTGCKMFNVIANRCNFLILFERVSNIEDALNAMGAKELK